MGYLEEIKHREDLLNKVTRGIKLQKEDQVWLLTHCAYNSKIGYPYLNRDIIKLTPNVTYEVNVRCENISYPHKIYPIIGVADFDGEISTNFDLKDFYGNKNDKNKTKTIGLFLDEIGKELKFEFKSKEGLMSVAYECEYYVDWLGRIIKESSDTGKSNFAMVRKGQIGSFLYECKDPNSDNYNIFSFSVKIK